MARSRAWPCSSCAYWQPYPGWKDVGTCDHTLSSNYGRMAMGTGKGCEQYVATRAQVHPGLGNAAEPRGPSPGETTCVDCHYWMPLETIPSVGRCDNGSSRLFGMPAFSDKSTEGCFVPRSLEGLEFMWCQSHHQTIYSAELPYHAGCRIFVSSASLPVEDEMELTLAGD